MSEEYILHMHNHTGWHTQEIVAENIEEVIKKGLHDSAKFLEKEYADSYRIEHNYGQSKSPRFKVIWDSDNIKEFLYGKPLKKGDTWWSDRFEIGEKDDCQSCGGTGSNHYISWKQCFSCGNQELDGKGTGKAMEVKE